jgi:hypothetical protein
MPIYPVADDKTKRPRTLDQLRACMEEARLMCEAINRQTIRYGDPHVMRHEEGLQEFRSSCPIRTRLATKMTMPHSSIAYHYELAVHRDVSCVGVGIELKQCPADGRARTLLFSHSVLPWHDENWTFWSDLHEDDDGLWFPLLRIAGIERRRLRAPWTVVNLFSERRISATHVHGLVGAFVALANADFKVNAVKTPPASASQPRGRESSSAPNPSRTSRSR